MDHELDGNNARNNGESLEELSGDKASTNGSERNDAKIRGYQFPAETPMEEEEEGRVEGTGLETSAIEKPRIDESGQGLGSEQSSMEALGVPFDKKGLLDSINDVPPDLDASKNFTNPIKESKLEVQSRQPMWNEISEVTDEFEPGQYENPQPGSAQSKAVPPWQTMSSVTLEGGDEQFKPVPLKDPNIKTETSSSSTERTEEKPLPVDQTRKLEKEVGSFGRGMYSGPSSGDMGVSPVPRKYSSFSHRNYSNISSYSFEGRGEFQSSVGSPLLHFGKAVLPRASPELMQLIDSSIRGSEHVSLQTLKKIVCRQEFLTQTGDEDELHPAKVVVDILLSKMRGADALDFEEESAAPRMMLSAGAAIVAGELIPWLPCAGDMDTAMSPRTRMCKGLTLVLKACTRNRAMCSAAGLLGVLLDAVREIFTCSHDGIRRDEVNTWNSQPLFEAIQVLGSHCLNVFDLHKWLGTIGDLIPLGKATNLALALEKTVYGQETRGPSHTFELDGESSGLLGPGESRWPFTNGYAFVTWLYIESFADTVHAATAAAAIAAAAVAKTGKSSAMSAAAVASALAGEGTAHMPRLYSFLSADNQGIEAYFHGQFLVVEIASAKGKKASLHFTHSFRPHQWYFIGLEHSHRHSILGKAESEVKLYVDGRLYESRPFDFPRVTKALAFCCIGTNPPPTMAGLQRRRRQCPLFAEMGPVYIFKEPIGPDKMARLAARGGDIVPSFGFGAGVPCSSPNEQARELAEENFALDAEIGPSLHLLYHPKLLVGRSCPDASPAGSAGMHRRPAEILGHVNVASRVRPMEALWAVAEGGPMALLPLTVGMVEKDSLKPTLGGNSYVSSSAASLAAPIFRIMSLALQHAGNAEELSRGHAPHILALILEHLLCVPVEEFGKDQLGRVRPDVRDEEIIAAVVQLAQAPTNNQVLKTQLFSNLLLDLKLWSRCTYGLQKKLLSSLADMVFTESSTMRAANAVQVLLDGCRQCYWIVPEPDSVHLFAGGCASRPIGELNALVDELLVIVELLVGSAQGSLAVADVRCLIQFVLDSPQPNQVARVLHLIYRLVVQPNVSRAAVFAETFLTSGGLEMLLALLQREGEAGETPLYASYLGYNKTPIQDDVQEEEITDGQKYAFVQEERPFKIERRASSGDTALSRFLTVRNLGGISLSIVADSARNNFQNVDSRDGIMFGMVSLLGALVTGGHLKLLDPSILCNMLLGSATVSSSPAVSTEGGMVPSSTSNMSVWLVYALQKAFQGAPKRLITDAVYSALLATVLKSEAGSISSASGSLNLYDSVHHFEHTQLMSAMLRTLPYAPRLLQIRALQDILFLTCTDVSNRAVLTSMPEWPEWILEILIYHYEVCSNKILDRGAISTEIEDLVYNFLIIILEHSMRQKDGWKDVESTIHCAEWLAMVGGSSTGEQRQSSLFSRGRIEVDPNRCLSKLLEHCRREESLPVMKRKLLGSLLDFAARELQVQTQVVAAAAAGVVAGGLSPNAARAEAEAAAYTSTSLAENALVLLMLVEDHLRLQCQLLNSSMPSVSVSSGPTSPQSFSTSPGHSPLGRTFSDGSENLGSRRFSSASESGGLSLDVLTSMADSYGQISVASMERLTAAAAAEPYESVRCAFASYGSCGVELSEGWKRRSQMWYGVGLPFKKANFGGGGNGWDAWNTIIEKDENGDWVELPLLRKSVLVLQSLLLDDAGYVVGGNSYGSGTGAGGIYSLQQLLDSDQPFFTMLRIVLVAMREEDKGQETDKNVASKSQGLSNSFIEKLSRMDSRVCFSSNMIISNGTKNEVALLWRILAPLLANVISESKRQRVLVACCIMYTEVWHAVSSDRKILRKNFIESLVPPFAALLRRWRPLLSGIHELTDADGQSPLAVEDRSLATDAHPHEAVLAMVTPAWAAAFASPPAAMALAMAAAGAGGADVTTSVRSTPFKREFSIFEKKAARLRSFATFQKSVESNTKVPMDKVSAKAAASAAARDQERAAKIGSGRGLGAVAMASAGQRRNASDRERAKRWNLSEAMNSAWSDCSAILEGRNEASEREGSGMTAKMRLILSMMVETARRMRIAEIDRRASVTALDNTGKYLSNRAWRTVVRCLMEMDALFGPIAFQLLPNQKVFWKLDFTENSLRMRKRLRRNYKGTDHHGAAADFLESQNQMTESEAGVADRKESDQAVPTSFLSQQATTILPEQSGYEESIEDDFRRSDAGELDDQGDDREHRLSTSSKQSFTDYNNTGTPLGSIVGSTASHPSGSPIIGASEVITAELKERILLETVAVMVQPLRISKGCFRVTTRHIFFVPDEDDSLDDPENKKSQINMTVKQTRERAWLLSSLREIHSRRYLLRKSALELFMLDRANFFFDFGSSGGRKKVYKAIVQARPPYLNNIYAATQRPEQILKRTKLTERWARWEISNFEYLMQLNTLSGRSYNDITQYPVFPWILSDYTSENLNLQDPNVYRDLSKPVGALNPIRLEKVLERYDNFDDPIIPRFHYGSHYSSAGTVLYYLVRLEPFTTLSIQLQGGRFDHADRMFGDIGSTWNGVLEDMSDVKELVPELFYMPEVFTNENNIQLGRTQKGEQLDGVRLPPWASSSVDFIQKHRAALESEYVSANLHDWIDLIFGYKQKGKEAINAHNVFFYITYEGAVDIDQINDPVLRKATQDQIAYFGQTPSQLLTTPHMKRKSLSDVLHLHTIFRNPASIQRYAVPSAERCNVPAGAISASNDALVIVDMNAPSCRVAVHKWQAHTPDNQGLPFYFQHGKPSANSGGGALVRMFTRQQNSGVTEWNYPRAVACAALGIKNNTILAITGDAYILTGGHADNSVKLISPEDARTLETAFGHSAPVTCLSLSPDGNTLLTGSRDSTAILWRIHSSNSNNVSTSTGMGMGMVMGSGIPDPHPHLHPVVSAATAGSGRPDTTNENNINAHLKKQIEGPINVLRGHVNELTACCINTDLDTVVTCSRMKGVLFHSITRGRLIRRLPLFRVDIASLSSEGILVVWDKIGRSLKTLTSNGTLIAEIEFPASEGDITSIAVSVDGCHAVVGTCSAVAELPYGSEAVHHDNSREEMNTKESTGSFPIDETHSTDQGRTTIQATPSIILYDLYTLQALHSYKLHKGQDVTCLALNRDNTALLVSTIDGELLIYTDPALSIKMVDEMLKLGWEGEGLSGYIS